MEGASMAERCECDLEVIEVPTLGGSFVIIAGTFAFVAADSTPESVAAAVATWLARRRIARSTPELDR